MKADLANREPAMAQEWDSTRLYDKIRAATKGRPGVRADRRSAVCERLDSSRACRQQGSQGHHHQVAHARRLRCTLRPRVGLPRAAHRDAGREDARPRRSEDRCQGFSRGMSCLCAQAGGRAAHGLQTPRRAGRLGSSVHDDDAAVRGGAAARARPHHRERSRVQGVQAGSLVPQLPIRAGRGRGGVRGQDLPQRVRSFRSGRSRRSGAAHGPGARQPARAGRRRSHVDRDLDHDTVDTAREPRGCGASAIRLRVGGIRSRRRARADDAGGPNWSRR